MGIVEDDEEVERTLQERLRRNQNLVNIKVAALLRRVESMVGECLVDGARRLRRTRCGHSTALDVRPLRHQQRQQQQERERCATTTICCCCQRSCWIRCACCRHYPPAWRSAADGTAVAGAETEGNAGDAHVAVSDSDSGRRRRAAPSPDTRYC
jgi:hypothetical protein